MNITTFEELMAVLKIVTDKGYSILLDDRLAYLRDDGIENEFDCIDAEMFSEGGYTIDSCDNGNAFSLHSADDDVLFHWIDIIQYQRLRVGDLSRGEVEIEELD